jgi:hypothetical protein
MADLYEILRTIAKKLPYEVESQMAAFMDEINSLDPNYVAPPPPASIPQPVEQVAQALAAQQTAPAAEAPAAPTPTPADGQAPA